MVTGKPQPSTLIPSNQSEDWSAFYTRALDYLDALDIEPEVADESHKAWKQLKLIFEGEDKKALQSLIDSGVVTAEHMLKPKVALHAIATTIKPEKYFWAHRDKLMSDLQQQPDEGSMHCLSTYVTSSQSQNSPMQQLLKRLKSWSFSMWLNTMRPGTG